MKEERVMLFYRKFNVRKHERGLLFKKGDFERFLDPGEYRLFDPQHKLTVERFDIAEPVFGHRLEDLFIKAYAKEVHRLFEVVETRADEVAVIYKDGRFNGIVGPEQRKLYWKGLVQITAQVVDIAKDFIVEPRVAKALLVDADKDHAYLADRAVFAREVPDAHVGLLYVDGELTGELQPGLHAFWKYRRGIAVELYDLRVKVLEVGGQEILTKDKVGLRLNMAANYQFTEPVKAVQAVKDPLDYLYKEIQFGLRAAVGARTLDALLEDKGIVDREVYDHVHEKFTAIGIEIRGIGVKDIILPGDMKEIMGKVVEAEKAAQANVIRRREETNATRALLNTAKVMEDNPIALRLKELEALEKVTGKIGNIAVYGGLDAVLHELVNIKR
jgi:regulator of protease activity HflC (stomatin/prohibitin superfamily)